MNAEAPLWILKLGDSVPTVRSRLGDFDDWIRRGLGLPDDLVRVAQLHRGEALPAIERVGALVITGSAAMLTSREAWSERAAAWLPEVIEDRPTLGICYGHQLIAHVLGGTVGDNPRGREIGSISVTLSDFADDPLFGEFSGQLCVQATHKQSVLDPPAGAVRLGANAADPNHVLRFAPRVWGVQFHPEFSADVIRGYLVERREQIEGEGLDVDALASAVTDSPDGSALLRRFASLLG